METNMLMQLNEVQLVYRTKHSGERPLVSSSQDAVDLLRPYYELLMETQEMFYMLLLDQGNRVKGIFHVSSGSLTATMADPRLVFAAALKSLAAAIIVAHNHPSGQLRPSEEDIRLTTKLLEGGRLLDIVVHDHVILTRNSYYSFADNGMIR